MQFFLTLSLLILGSGLVTFRIREDIRPYRDHIGFILLLYGFGNFLLFIASDFRRLIEEDTVFAVLKLGLWINLMVIGFLLSYPLLERHLFSKNPDIKDQGRRVFEGFDGIRMILGLGGFVLAVALVLIQLKVF